MSVRRLSLPTMFAFGVGQAAEGIKNQAFNVFLLFYYQQVVGISGSLAGLAIGIALLFDAVTDPAAGVLSDRFKSKWGRRHPFMFMSVFPLFLAFIALFNPPDSFGETANFIWMTTFAILVRGSLTLYYVPHLALGAEMAQDYNQRSTLYALSSVFAITAMAMVSFVGYRFFFPTTELYSPGTLNPDAYLSFSLTFATAMALVIVLCCVGTAREIPHLRTRNVDNPLTIRNVITDFSALLRNRSFVLIIGGLLLTTMTVTIEAVFNPYMGVHFWGLPTEKLAFASLATLIGLWIGLPLVPLITRTFDKKHSLVFSAIIIVINANTALSLRLLEVDWFPTNESPWIFWIYFAKNLVQAICLPILLASFNSMFADIADEIELESGERLEGVIFSARSFGGKATGALGALIGGIALDLIEFPTGAVAGTVPADTIWWVGFIEGPATSVLSLCGVLFYLNYQIDRKRHADIVRQVNARTAVSFDAKQEKGKD